MASSETRVLVMMPARRRKAAVLAAFADAPRSRAEPVATLDRVQGGRARTALILGFEELARREPTAAASLGASLRDRCRLILAFGSQDVLRAAPVLGHADGWLLTDRTLRRIAEIVELSGERYCVLPADFGNSWTRQAARLRRVGRLTEAERRFLARLARGESNRSIAQQLDQSEEQVRAMIRRAMRKLEVRNRTEAAVFLKEAGLDRSTPGPPGRRGNGMDAPRARPD